MLTIRRAITSDIPEIEAMIADFVKGHPAENHPRSRQALHDAYFGARAFAHLLVAERKGLLVGMVEWQLIHDMFWGMYGARTEWLYVKPQFRGSGIVAALVARACKEAATAGAQFLHGGAGEGQAKLYDRVAFSIDSRDCFLSGKGFQAFAKLDGLLPRDIVRGLPPQEWSRQAVDT